MNNPVSTDSTFLDRIVATKIREVAERKTTLPIDELKQSVFYHRKCISLKGSLQQSTTGIISEFKRKSPSKGWIHENANLKSIVTGYQEAGASGISILTDTDFFGGSTDDLKSVRDLISIPILRKDFILDEYQLYEAKAIGADVVLLIAAVNDAEKTKNLAKKAHELGLEVLLEIHNELELGHLNDFVDIVGINNRDLKTFQVNLQTSRDLCEKIPEHLLKISESGISNPETVKELRKLGFRGFLMGENFMKTQNPAETLHQFIRQIS